MDEFENGKLVGTFLGILVGSVELVPGKSNKALHTNGIDQWVNIGNHRDKCLGNLNRCTKGFVMALWLKGNVMIGEEYYVNCGGHTERSIGMTLLEQDGNLVAEFRIESIRWRVGVVGFESHVWYHVVLVWTEEGGEQVYLNGCLCGRMKTGIPHTNNQEPGYTDFVFGNANTDLNGKTTLAGEMTLDEVRVWDADLDEEGAWKLYSSDILPWCNTEVPRYFVDVIRHLNIFLWVNLHSKSLRA